MAFPPKTGSNSGPTTATSADDAPAREGERIAKLLARAGIASRREIERFIADGRVALDGVVIETPATVLKNLRGVTVDGNPVAAAEPARLFMFHKPSGLITAERDPTGRPTIYAALRNALPPGAGRVMPVGRLDINTEGLLMMTNDGELKRAMELPANGVPRTYRARTFGDISQSRLEELMHGIEIDGIRYGPINANLERSAGRNKWIEMTLTEGKNREIRRVLEHLGLEVSRLMRLRYGPFDLGELPRGAAEEVPQVVVERFRKGLKGDVATREQQAVHSGKARPARVAAPAPVAAPRPVRERPAEEERPQRRGPQRVRPVADKLYGAKEIKKSFGDKTRAVRAAQTAPSREGAQRDDRRPPAGRDRTGPARDGGPARPQGPGSTRPGSGPRKPRGRG